MIIIRGEAEIWVITKRIGTRECTFGNHLFHEASFTQMTEWGSMVLTEEVSGEQKAVKLFCFVTNGCEITQFLVKHFINLVALMTH